MGDPELNARFACQKREYWYYVPYSALLLEEERGCAVAAGLVDSSDLSELARQLAKSEEARCIWLMGLPDEFSVLQLKCRLQELLGDEDSKSIEHIEASADSVGTATVWFANVGVAMRACLVMDCAKGL